MIVLLVCVCVCQIDTAADLKGSIVLCDTVTVGMGLCGQERENRRLVESESFTNPISCAQIDARE